jgi:predicted RNA-binding protein YlxR (DUF448 family)
LVRRWRRSGREPGAGVGATSRSEIAIGAAGPTEAGETGPWRRCLVTGELRERGAMLRFVIGPDGELVPDLAARLPGRGWWLSPRRDIVEQAVRKRVFARAARRAVRVADGLADRIETLLAGRLIDGLGLARRAGLAVAGFERVCEAIGNGKAAVLVAALDGAEGSRRKLAGRGRGLPLVRVLTAAEIGAAFGRAHVVNAALGRGPLSRRLVADAEKLAGFRANAMVEQTAHPAAAGPVR